MKDKLVVSFSGGETSAFMAQWIWNNWKDLYEMVFIFANTGQENEETLIFVEKCSEYFGFPVIWVEAKVNQDRGKGTRHTIVSYKTASRKGEPFEDVIKKHGIPNQSAPHCTRELKLYPINSYIKSIGWKNHYTAIGIRADEFDRINAKHKESKILYPLISEAPMTKPRINLFWSQMPFRLNLKGYQGNCISCWKKSDNKLYQIAKDNKDNFDFMAKMEKKYEFFIPQSRAHNKKIKVPVRFFRGNKSVQDIIEQSKSFNKNITDDSRIIEIQQDLFNNESCDIYSHCN